MARLRSCNLALIFIAAMNTSSAVKLHKNLRYIREPRQLGVGPPQYTQPVQPTSSSSFDHWWPYPAWTATAAVGTTSAITFSTTQDTAGMPFPTSSVLDNSDSSAVPSTTLDAFASSTSPASSASSASPSPSTSIPAPTSTVEPQPHTSSFRNFITNPHIFIPLLASVLGAVLLVILFWCFCRRRRRRRHRERNRSSYYYPSGGHEWQVVRAEKRDSRPWWAKLFGSREDTESVILGPRYVGIDDLDMAEAEKDVERRAGAGGVGEKRDLTSATEDDGDGDPFLPSRPKRARTGGSAKPRSFRDPLSPSRAPSSAATRPLLPALSLLRDSFDFEAEEDGGSDREDEQVPWESLRHKSIKRAILAKVDEERRWTDSMRGLRSAKAVGAAARSLARLGGSSAAPSDHDRGRSRSTRTDRSRGQRGEQLEEGERGFRIMAESPPPQIPTPGSSGSGGKQAAWSLASAFPFPLFSGGGGRHDGDVGQRGGDPYTPVPTRMKSGSRSRGSSLSGSPVRVSPVKRGTERQGRPAFVASSPSVLRMRSPPSVMTPQMESALCFTPVVGSSARMRSGVEDMGCLLSSFSPEGIEPPRRGRLVNSVIQARTQERSEQEMEPEPGTIHTKTYRDRTDRAMRRVEEIVESGRDGRRRGRDY